MKLNKSNKPKVCFIALNSYNILSNSPDIKHIGGAEAQQLHTAHWLLGQEYRVSFITLDYGQKDGIEYNSIQIYKAYSPNEGIPILRLIYPRMIALWNAMTRANADVYYQRGAGSETGLAALWCYFHKRPLIFATSSDTDCLAELPKLDKLWERILYKWGIKKATAIVVQTEQQQNIIKSFVNRTSYIIKNCYPPPLNTIPNNIISDSSTRVLWIGRLTWQKRFDWLLELAALLPEIIFNVIGVSKAKDKSQESIIQRANTIGNVKMHGFIPYSDMPVYFNSTSILCCTSSTEGFPNTFLEAWSRGIPVLSTFDPDGIINKNLIGWTASSVNSLANTLKKIAATPEELTRAGNASRAYYLNYHTPDVCLQPLDRILTDITR